jgi:hypothetical protein
MLATIPAKTVRLARRGTYRLSLCVGTMCVTKTLRARHGKARVPNIVARTRRVGPVTVRLIGPRGRATGAL